MSYIIYKSKKSNEYGNRVMNKLPHLIDTAATKLIPLHQTVSIEATLLIRNSVKIDNKDHTNIGNMRQSRNIFSR